MTDNWEELNDIQQPSNMPFSKYVGCFIHILVILTLLWLIIMILSGGEFEGSELLMRWSERCSSPAIVRNICIESATKKEAIGDSLRSFAKMFLGGNKMLLFQHFVNGIGLNEKELDKIHSIIAKRKK